ncbi:MAG: hypothetical protein JSV66_14375 [Trueperaceae bacterium]|nr:MAG: hypothetical protein JSV66_14375 [Trueperaceae bacterium]
MTRPSTPSSSAEATPTTAEATPTTAEATPTTAEATPTTAEATGAGAVVETTSVPQVGVLPADVGVVTREVVIADLPFLITEAPTTTPGEEIVAEDDGVSRPLAGRRATVNPFSPIVFQEPSLSAVAEVPPSTTPEVVEVKVPPAPSPTAVAEATAVQEVIVPTPNALAPPTPTQQARELPRPLPSGNVLPTTPEILRTARSETAIPPATTVEEPTSILPELTQVALIREPSTTTNSLRNVDSTLPGSDANTVPNPIRSVPEPVAGAADSLAGENGTTLPTDTPLVAGSTPLSRYLRDEGYSFTGSVLGPISIGVFRSSIARSPVVIQLGQTLPDTDIVLTDLRGQYAEFTLDGESEQLILDLRR